MSFDITFIRLNGRQITPEEFGAIVEKLTMDDAAPPILSVAERKRMVARLQKELPRFVLKEYGTGPLHYLALESNVKDLNYDVCFYKSQISISAPYWDSNNATEIFKEFDVIGKILTSEFQMTGYDNQTGAFIGQSAAGPQKYTEIVQLLPSLLNGPPKPNYLLWIVGAVVALPLIIVLIRKLLI